MSLHTQLPIYKVAYDLLDVMICSRPPTAISDCSGKLRMATTIVRRWPRCYECVHIMTLVARAFRIDVFYAVLAVLITLLTLVVLQVALILTHTPVHLDAPHKAASNAHTPIYTPAPKK